VGVNDVIAGTFLLRNSKIDKTPLGFQRPLGNFRYIPASNKNFDDRDDLNENIDV